MMAEPESSPAAVAARVRERVASLGYAADLIRPSETGGRFDFHPMLPERVAWMAGEMARAGPPICHRCSQWQSAYWRIFDEHPPELCTSSTRMTEDCGVDRALGRSAT